VNRRGDVHEEACMHFHLYSRAPIDHHAPAPGPIQRVASRYPSSINSHVARIKEIARGSCGVGLCVERGALNVGFRSYRGGGPAVIGHKGRAQPLPSVRRTRGPSSGGLLRPALCWSLPCRVREKVLGRVWIIRTLRVLCSPFLIGKPWGRSEYNLGGADTREFSRWSITSISRRERDEANVITDITTVSIAVVTTTMSVVAA